MELTNYDLLHTPTKDYLPVILTYAQTKNILSKEKIAQINIDILLILEEKIRTYTGGDSSVSKAIGQSLMDSIIYVNSLYLKQFSLTKAIHQLSSLPFTTINLQAKQFLKLLLQELTLEIENLQRTLLDTSLSVYNDTLKHGLSVFIATYNFDYHAQDSVLTLDYPTYIPISKKIGIELVATYIHYQQIEHHFYSFLPISYIHTILHHYHNGVSYLIFNISEVLWEHILLHFSIYETPLTPLTPITISTIYTVFTSKTPIEQTKLLEKAFDLACEKLLLTTTITSYFKQGLPSLCSRIQTALQYHTLDKELVIL